MDFTPTPENKVAVSLMRDSSASIEEIVEATKLAKSTARGHIYSEYYDGPTSMERLQAYHDRMDKLLRVHTRLPEQIMLDAARGGEDCSTSTSCEGAPDHAAPARNAEAERQATFRRMLEVPYRTRASASSRSSSSWLPWQGP
jgi:hypothetical protein